MNIRDTVAAADFYWESGPPNGDNKIVSRSTDTGAGVGGSPFSDTTTQAVRIEGDLVTAAVREPDTLALTTFGGLMGLTGASKRRRRSAA